MQEIENEIKNLKHENNIAILDVDRTIINTTSWYQACMTSNLLISENNIKKFKELNDKTFFNKTKDQIFLNKTNNQTSSNQTNDQTFLNPTNNQHFINPTEEKLKEFRKNTLKLIEKTIDSKYLEKVKQITNIDETLKIGDYTTSWRFYTAGIYTAQKLVTIYKDAIKYIKYLSKYYGNTLEIIFLTAGYEPFIRGVVDEIINITKLKKIKYLVIGSKIKFEKGNIEETFHIDQFEKQKIVEKIIKQGCKIRFLADDSDDNTNLFNIVKQNGGEALHIIHKSNQKENETWKNYIKKLTKQNIKEKLKNDDSYISLNKNYIQLPEFLEKLSKDTNEIGITAISYKNYKIALDNIIEKIKSHKDKEEFSNDIEKIVFKKEEKIYLRGKLYYNWLPQYIFLDDRPLNDRWKELMNICINLLDIVNSNKIINNLSNYYEQVIIYSLIDHLLEGILFILNLIEQNILKNNNTYQKEQNILKSNNIYPKEQNTSKNNNIYQKEHEQIIQITQDISDLLYAYIYKDNNLHKISEEVISKLKKLEIIRTLPQYTKNFKTMRELDDNIIIFKFVKSIIDELEKKKINTNYIISFPYGGIALGFGAISYMKIALKKKETPKLINSHFSSKQMIRENRIEKEKDFSIFKSIPDTYKKDIEKIKNGNNTIILLDNNVTTFKTLDLCKNFLMQTGNKIYAGVPAINYDNIVKNLCNKKSETLVPNWRQVLDFYPVDEYVTAFNTWNANQKANILEKIYYNKNNTHIVENTDIKIKNKNFIFKICRIQNIQDLKVVAQNGANMIGIHAVYPDRIKYLKNELKYKPMENHEDIDEDLPVATFEIDSIRDIQKIIPNDMKQAILFERPLSIKNMIKTCDIYGVPKEKIYIQLHHRTDKQYIEKVKKNLSEKIIVTVGLFQKDFKEYFWKMNNILNPKTDYILLDLSKHQPDLITYSENLKEGINRVLVLNQLAKLIENNDVPIIIADDTTVEQMREYLSVISKYNIKIKGIDMQNVVELETNKQRYQKIEYMKNTYQAKIRKSPTAMAEWKEFFIL